MAVTPNHDTTTAAHEFDFHLNPDASDHVSPTQDDALGEPGAALSTADESVHRPTWKLTE